MKLDILKALNTERTARRAAVVVTNQDSGAQRLVTQDKVAADPLKDVLEAHLRSGKSGIEETAEGKVFLTVHVPPMTAEPQSTLAACMSPKLCPISWAITFVATAPAPLMYAHFGLPMYARPDQPHAETRGNT